MSSDSKKVKVLIIGLINLPILAIGRMIASMVRVPIHGRTEDSTLDLGRKI